MARPRKITRRGPQTEAGIARIRAANIIHGLFTRNTLLESERTEDLQQLSVGLHGQFDPEGDYEALLVDNIVDIAWRWARSRRIQTAAAENLYLDQYDEVERRYGNNEPGFARMQERACLVRIGINPEMEKLLRYETALERQFYRAVNHLERVQRSRRGDDVAAPAALDVTLSDGAPLQLPVS